MLHRVVEQRSMPPTQRVLEVTPDWLCNEICTRREQGYFFVPLDDVSTSPRQIAITLDDGYADNLTVGLPLFERLQVPFTVYVTTGFIDNRMPMWWYDGQFLGLTTEQLRQLDASPLCTIGAHTVSHPHLSQLPADAQRLEIEESKLQLEGILGHPVRHFSYPHGDYNDTTVQICRSLGFSTAVTTSGRTVRTDTDLMTLDRINIVQP